MPYIKHCKNCKYFFKHTFTGYGRCIEFGNRERHEECCCQFWYPDVVKIKKEEE